MVIAQTLDAHQHSHSSKNPDPTLTIVLKSSYKLISACTNTSGNHLFLSAHFATFPGTLSNAFSKSTKHNHAQLFLFFTEFLSYPSQNKQLTSCAFPRHTAKLHIIYRYQSSYSVLQPSLHSLHCVLQQLYFFICSTIHHIPFPLKIGRTTLVFHFSGISSPSTIF